MSEFFIIDPAEMAQGKYTTASLLARLRNNIVGYAEGKGNQPILIQTGAIQAGTITGDKWKDDSITADDILGVLQAGDFANGSITASKLKLLTSFVTQPINSNETGVDKIHQGNMPWALGYKTWAEPDGITDYQFELGIETAGTGPSYATNDIAGLGKKSYVWMRDRSGYGTLLAPRGSIYFWIQYITASPPYDLGDGQIPIFIYGVQPPGGKSWGAMSADPSPPWAAEADIQDYEKRRGPDGITRKIRRRPILPPRPTNWANTAERSAYLDALKSPPDWIEEEITQEIKNRPMDKTPHPFGNVKQGFRPVLIDPVGPVAERLLALHDDGANVLGLIQNGYIEIGDDLTSRKGPPGVTIVGAKWRNSGRSRPKPNPSPGGGPPG